MNLKRPYWQHSLIHPSVCILLPIIFLGSVIAVLLFWCTSIPLGISGEWTWDRSKSEPDLFWNLIGGTVAAGLFVAYVLQGWQRLEIISNRPRHLMELAAWLTGLVVFSFIWLWVVQEVAPSKNRLGKSAFVLYYASSSGYFTRARYLEPRPGPLLAGYEDLMREGDVLHTGTHPPGLFLVFQGLIAACESSVGLSTFLDATQPRSFIEACDVIAANNSRRSAFTPLLPLDRRVLWLATLLVVFASSLTVLPLYALLQRSVTIPTAWIGSALWPAIPAVAVFAPKSDVVFPLIGVLFLWLWLSAWDRRSPALALLAGAVIWCGLNCSLAFLPVVLVAGMMTLASIKFDSVSAIELKVDDDSRVDTRPTIGTRRWLCIFAAGIGFATPTLMLWRLANVNLLNIWWLNYRNHAGFYQQYHRTYWKWLIFNPLEVSCAAGWPVAFLAFVACCCVLGRFRRDGNIRTSPDHVMIVGSIVSVWGLLWLTGKNSGEAARLWILFFPWLIWLASIQIDAIMTSTEKYETRHRQVLLLLAIQFMVCLLTVAKVSGFHADTG